MVGQVSERLEALRRGRGRPRRRCKRLPRGLTPVDPVDTVRSLASESRALTVHVLDLALVGIIQAERAAILSGRCTSCRDRRRSTLLRKHPANRATLRGAALLRFGDRARLKRCEAGATAWVSEAWAGSCRSTPLSNSVLSSISPSNPFQRLKGTSPMTSSSVAVASSGSRHRGGCSRSAMPSRCTAWAR